MDGVPRLATHFHVFKGNHLMALGIYVQILVDLEFLGRPHTKIRKPHLLVKNPNFVAGGRIGNISLQNNHLRTLDG